ncbi:YodL domain-containing protein [uncultured Ruminococcus sp.]|uniref:YodL domain-containing protein n=1 Tax=uncultured Ruminococcus sp. TaxID=165186 RepID=UPI0025936F48|nr:YodL domain-containing protein [uncultured Ruminococcus sp.]
MKVKHYHREYDSYKTERQWALEGFLVAENVEGIELLPSKQSKQPCKYYQPNEVRPATESELQAFFQPEKERRREQARAYRKARLEREQEERERELEEAKWCAVEPYKKKIEELSIVINALDNDPSTAIAMNFEATGYEYEDELLQLSIINFKGNILFNSYFKPKKHKEWTETEQVNGISPEMVADRPAISEKISEINAIIENSDTIIGYNTQFDIGFLKANGAIVPDDLETVDVMEDFAKIYGEWNSARGSYKWQKLTRAAEYYGYDWSQRAETAHNSLGDCYATLFVYDKINTDTMVIERVIDGKRVGIELTPAEISQAYYIKENDDRRQDILNALDEMDSLKIGNIDISNDFLKKSTTFINDVIYRYEKMDDHLEDYNMAIEDVLDNADKNYANKLVSHYAQNMSAADKEQYIESAEMAMDWNDTNEPAISRLEYMLYTTLITERDYDKIKQDCLKVPQNNTGEYIDKMIKTMRTEAKAYFIEGIDENRKNGVEISELDNIIYKKLIDERRTEHTREVSSENYKIYQLKDGEKYHGIRFEPYHRIEAIDINLNKTDYDLVYEGKISEIKGNSIDEKLENIYSKFNRYETMPETFMGHSLSISDVVEIGNMAYYVDNIGFKKLSSFLDNQEQDEALDMTGQNRGLGR